MMNFLTRLSRFHRSEWEMLASGLIALGVIMLMQPLSLTLFSFSFPVTLIGTVTFIIVSHFPE
jgi:hypothetical protein